MSSATKDITLELAEFEAIAALTYEESGLQLVAEKMSMIQSRLRNRLKAVGMQNYKDYADYVSSNAGRDERRQMISALTTNVSHFFRENHHFEILASTLNAMISKSAPSAPLRIWSAGCSNGQEAVSIAITLLETLKNIQDLDVKILATDIDPNVIAFASDGIYHDRHVGGVPGGILEKYFLNSYVNGEQNFKVADSVRRLISFKELNLLSDWPMKLPMQYVFCRNVVIYFDAETQSRLWPRFRSQLDPSGFLFLGHSERVADAEGVGFESAGPTTYRPLSVGQNQKIDLR